MPAANTNIVTIHLSQY